MRARDLLFLGTVVLGAASPVLLLGALRLGII